MLIVCDILIVLICLFSVNCKLIVFIVLIGKKNKNQDEISFKRPRFETLMEEAQHKWDIPDELRKLVEKYFERFVQEKDLKESFLIANTVQQTC